MSGLDGITTSVSNFFQPGSKPPLVPVLYEQQPGCGVKIYYNSSNAGGIDYLFYEIMDAMCDRSTVDIAGNFSITLNASRAWDEIINPNDFLRIFMGDQVSTSPSTQAKGAYNFAFGTLSQASQANFAPPPNVVGNVFIPSPGLEGKSNSSTKINPSKVDIPIQYLTMYERFIGKVDRIDKIVSPPARDGGTETTYVVSGRSLGSLLQDISLYYNQYLPGFNALSIFQNLNLTNTGNSPDYYVGQLLAFLLSACPIPQWQLPKALVADMNYGTIQSDNYSVIETFLNNITTQSSENVSTASPANVKYLQDLNQVLSLIKSNPSLCPYVIFSTLGIYKCAGSAYDLGLLNSTNTGAYDLLKGYTDSSFNEFFFDVCPGGDPQGGPASSQKAVPSFVLRQLPYDIDYSMIDNLAQYVNGPAQEADPFTGDFPQVYSPLNNGKSTANQSLFDLNSNAVTVFGPMAKSNDITTKALQTNLTGTLAQIASSQAPESPTLINYQVGRSCHDQSNGWICNGDYHTGGGDQSSMLPVTEAGGFILDVTSVSKFGFKMMSVNTMYFSTANDKGNTSNPFFNLARMGQLLANWYFLNPYFLNGKLVCKFLPDARLGIPCKYFETAQTPTNPYSKMELFYVQGVTDQYTYGRPITTTLTVVRGLRYNLGINTTQTQKNLGVLAGAYQRVQSFFGNSGGVTL